MKFFSSIESLKCKLRKYDRFHWFHLYSSVPVSIERFKYADFHHQLQTSHNLCVWNPICFSIPYIEPAHSWVKVNRHSLHLPLLTFRCWTITICSLCHLSSYPEKLYVWFWKQNFNFLRLLVSSMQQKNLALWVSAGWIWQVLFLNFDMKAE